MVFTCGLLGCVSRLVFVFCETRLVSFGSYFVKVPDSVMWNKWECLTRGLVPRADVSLRWTPEAIEVMMRKPCSEKTQTKKKQKDVEVFALAGVQPRSVTLL